MNTKTHPIEKVDSVALETFVRDLLMSVGIAPDHAKISAELLVLANLRGIDTHGVSRLKGYLHRIALGTIKTHPTLSLHDIPGSPMGVLDGDCGLGFVVAERAIQYAVEKARKYGIGLIWAKNSNHFGAAGLYSLMAAQQRMIGIVTTNVTPMISMPSYTDAVVGNNPIAIAVPMHDHPPFSLDISLSSVAMGKLLLAIQEGKTIPDNWAMDPEGNPTTDPSKGYAGFLLPMAMHKGFALALALDILTGVLSGGPFLKDLPSMYQQPGEASGTTHLMLAVDPMRLMDEQVFHTRMSQWKEQLQAIISRDTGKPMHIPGEGLADIEAERRMNGIPVSPNQLSDLAQLALQHGVPLPGWGKQ